MKNESQLMKEVNIGDLQEGDELLLKDTFIFWHPKKPEQFKAKVSNVFHIPNIVYMPNGDLSPKIVYELEKAKEQGWLYTLI